MGAISGVTAAMKSLFRSSARSASAEAAGEGARMGKVFVDGLVAQLGGMAASAGVEAITAKMRSGSDAAAQMGAATRSASNETALAMKSAADAAGSTYTKIVNVTNNVYQLKNAYSTAAAAARDAGTEISASVDGVNAGNLQAVSSAYRDTSDAAREVSATVVDSSTKSNSAWEKMKDAAEDCFERIKSGWESVKTVYSAVVGSMQSALSSVSGALSAVGGWFDRIGSRTFIVATAIAAGFALAVKNASEDEVALRRFNLILGDAADKARQWVESFSSGGLGDFGETISRYAQLQTLLKSLNFNSTPAADLSQQIIMLGTDLAAFNGMKPDEVFDDLMSAITGSAKATKFYAGALTEAVIKQQLLNQGIDPDKATDAEKAYARFTLIMKNNASALGYAAQTSNEYDGIVRALRAELTGLSGDIGDLLKGGYTKIASITLGIVRVVREWINGNKELAKQIATIAEKATVLTHVLPVIGFSFSGAATTLTVFSGVVGAVLSPLGLLVIAVARATGVADSLRQAYEAAFDGALKRAVDFVAASRVFGVSIADWYKLGALAVAAAWNSAIAYVVGRLIDLTVSVAGAYESLLLMQVGGLSVGNWIAAGLAIGKRAFYEIKAVALDAAFVLSEMWIDGKTAALDFYASIIGKLQTIALKITDIYYAARGAIAGVQAVKDPFGFTAEIDKIRNEAKAARAEIQKSLNPQEAKQNAYDADFQGEKQKQQLRKDLDSSGAKASAEAARQESSDLLAGKADQTYGYLADERGITEAVTGEMMKRQQAFAEQAQRIRAEIASIRQNGSSTENGIDIDGELKNLMNRIVELSKNNPLAEEYKKLAGLDGGATAAEAKATAEGSFRASEISRGTQNQTQDKIAEAVQKSALYSRDTANGIASLNEKFSVAF